MKASYKIILLLSVVIFASGLVYFVKTRPADDTSNLANHDPNPSGTLAAPSPETTNPTATTPTTVGVPAATLGAPTLPPTSNPATNVPERSVLDYNNLGHTGTTVSAPIAAPTQPPVEPPPPPPVLAPAATSTATATTPTAPAAAPDLSQTEGVPGGYWIIRSGDALSVIAQKVYGTSTVWQSIVSANPECNPNRLKLNMKLKLPTREEVGLASESGSSSAATTSTAPSTATTATTPTRTSTTVRTYTTREGDSLGRISKRFYGTDTKWNKIYEANKRAIGTNPNRLRSGIDLVIPE